MAARAGCMARRASAPGPGARPFPACKTQSQPLPLEAPARDLAEIRLRPNTDTRSPHENAGKQPAKAGSSPCGLNTEFAVMKNCCIVRNMRRHCAYTHICDFDYQATITLGEYHSSAFFTGKANQCASLRAHPPLDLAPCRAIPRKPSASAARKGDVIARQEQEPGAQ